MRGEFASRRTLRSWSGERLVHVSWPRRSQSFRLSDTKSLRKCFVRSVMPAGRKCWSPAVDLKFGERTYAIHLWNERWRAAGQDKNAAYPEGCLYEQLKRRYLAAYPRPTTMPLAESA